MRILIVHCCHLMAAKYNVPLRRKNYALLKIHHRCFYKYFCDTNDNETHNLELPVKPSFTRDKYDKTFV